MPRRSSNWPAVVIVVALLVVLVAILGPAIADLLARAREAGAVQ